MASTRDLEERQLLYRVSSDVSADQDDDNDAISEYELGSTKESSTLRSSRFSRLPTWSQIWKTPTRRRHGRSRSPFLNAVRRRRSKSLCAVRFFTLFSTGVMLLVILCGILFPSYTHLPPRYADLRRRSQQSEAQGRGNIHNEKVFIAASIYDRDGQLLGGEWGERLRQLINVLGPDNVFLSIYENDADENAQLAMKTYENRVTCKRSIVHEHLDLAPLPHVNTPSGASRLKRIAFLAEVRNRALRPLDDPESPAYHTRFDKILYVNDIYFDPVDAANLLFSTKVDELSGKTDYRAACAVDFIMPSKFYDTFATRDTEGYQMGVPFFPWFTNAGNGTSRRDVLSQTDAVRVKSCWGGMVAFEAKWFQPRMHTIDDKPPANTSTTPALRFRSEPDTYWDSSECCLIHADLASLAASTTASGIYMNPYIRVAYSPRTLHWLAFTRRFERLYPWIHQFVNFLSSRPGFNPRRTQKAGDRVIDKVWVWDDQSKRILDGLRGSDTPALDEKARKRLHGSWQQVVRTATAGQFCGVRGLLYINEHPKEGESNWAMEDVP
ncbi:hypothetical protein Q7P37_007955 [Cladosporium fusiforme]